MEKCTIKITPFCTTFCLACFKNCGYYSLSKYYCAAQTVVTYSKNMFQCAGKKWKYRGGVGFASKDASCLLLGHIEVFLVG